MGFRLRSALLTALVLSAALSVCMAYRSIRRTADSALPEEVYQQLVRSCADAEYYLRESDGRVAVFAGNKGRSPVTLTEIETAQLRSADRALLEAGIPVGDRRALLRLLEDLGS